MENVAKQTLDGLSFDSIWTFICIGFALIGVFLVVAKLIDQIRKWVKERQDKKKLNKTDITEEIATKVMEKLTPQIDKKFDDLDKKFDEIDKKFAKDKEAIDMHTSQLNAQKYRVDRLDNDSKALLHGMSALLGHEINGNSIDKLTKTQDAMRNYLIDGIYKEEDWK